ncbi:hypothetical protein FA95DRAFT_1506830 [Auriscalpium vulgare]|uniref:Uncharacterized protein n=1 Tax=Auriscalpium vulgare TaxID=40419 RepID=A0ACB8R118_9AGAM|nr:hypothetical protein FA95DRAFT_1506830 [Auriscalpium vulgare]
MVCLDVLPSGSESVVDREDRILVQLAGRPPANKSWPEQAKSMSRVLDEVAPLVDFEPGKHQRGQYPFMHAGFTHGGGSEEPHNTKAGSDDHQLARSRILAHEGIQRAAGFQSSATSVNAPRLFGHLDQVVEDAGAHNPLLKKPFLRSVFPMATFNFGPQALTVPHRDSKNVPFGWCAVTALGDFDYMKGGHLIIWELKLIIEFPPGSTILLPSALLTHSNTPIQDGETRQSFTQWCSGDLVRWHAYGQCTEKALNREDPQLKKRLDEELDGRWKESVKFFSKRKELQDDLRRMRARCAVGHGPDSMVD